MTKFFSRTILLALSFAFLAACDYDYNELGADIIEDDIHHGMSRLEASVTAYDTQTGAVQSNNLPLNAIGAYENPVFGKTLAHFVTQVQLASTTGLTFVDPVIDSVYLYVPYRVKSQTTNSDGDMVYKLDSIFGDSGAKFRLHLYENKFYLRTSDPSATDGTLQKYYSDDMSLIENNRGTLQLNNAEDAAQNEEFLFSTAAVKRTYEADGQTKTAETLAPGMLMYLDKEFFQQKILEAPSGSLANNAVFTEYFRGIYFKAEQIGNQSALGMPDFSGGYIMVKYNNKVLDNDGEYVMENGEFVTEAASVKLNLTGNTINFFENTYTDTFTSAITNSDPVSGDEQLYIKGGSGSMAIIDILSEADINALRDERVLINEANLTFYIDKGAMANAKEPMRVYLYDLNNKKPLFDYTVDGTTNLTNPKNGKYVHGGLLSLDTDGRGLGYKLRITNHINNIINKDSTNVKLGLVVTENINVTSNASLKNPFTADGVDVKYVPVMDVVNPFGTVLYGSNSSVEDGKRLKLEIYYTKPN